MANATYFQRGESLDYVNATSDAIEAGQIISLGSRIGVAGCKIPAGAVGSVHMTGVFAMPKGTGEIALGADVKFDGTNIVTSGSTAVIGYCTKAAASDDTVVYVKLLG